MFILWANLNRASKTFLFTALTTTSPLCHHNLWAVVEIVIKIFCVLLIELFSCLIHCSTLSPNGAISILVLTLVYCLLLKLFCVCSCTLCSASSHCIGNICSIVSFILIVPSEAIFSSFFCTTYFQCTCCLLYGCTDSTCNTSMVTKLPT